MLSGAGLALAGVLSVCALRGFGVQITEKAPAFRQEGPADAPVVIAEFSDFECPSCKAAEPAVRQILSIYGDQVRFIFKHFPLEHIHLWALQAAKDAECAGRAGKFWPYHDALYDHQAEWVGAKSPPDALLSYAAKVGLSPDAVKACSQTPEILAAINADIAEGNSRWVGGTPTFFINGRRFVGDYQLTSMGIPWIDSLLKKKK